MDNTKSIFDQAAGEGNQALQAKVIQAKKARVERAKQEKQ
jgi:hypothetical protein